jgi:beta-glucosidase
LQISKNKISTNDALTVTVNVTNTGTREGAEIVQLYLSDIVATVTPPVKSLKRFSKISLKPGEKQTVKFELGRDDFAFIGRENNPVVEPGDFKVGIGGLNETFTIL